MEERSIASWEDFEREIGAIFDRYSRKRQEAGGGVSVPLFRGQTKVSWQLKTTLERYAEPPYTMKQYWKLTRNLQNHVESVTGRRWDIGEYPDPEPDHPQAPPGYPFMAHLRHHGFPSPLLDWSRSPYVAAFFATRAPAEHDEDATVFCFMEYYGAAKIWGRNEPHIVGVGPNIATTPRHFPQQSEYTICRVLRTDGYAYASHEDVFQKGDPVQDVLTKYRIPASQRGYFLRRLDLMNINAYSLFDNEEGLMETLAYRAIKAKCL